MCLPRPPSAMSLSASSISNRTKSSIGSVPNILLRLCVQHKSRSISGSVTLLVCASEIRHLTQPWGASIVHRGYWTWPKSFQVWIVSDCGFDESWKWVVVSSKSAMVVHHSFYSISKGYMSRHTPWTDSCWNTSSSYWCRYKRWDWIRFCSIQLCWRSQSFVLLNAIHLNFGLTGGGSYGSSNLVLLRLWHAGFAVERAFTTSSTSCS